MNCVLIMDEVEKLIRKQAIALVTPVAGQFLSHVFTVPKKDSSQCLVVNLRPLNHFVKNANVQDGRGWHVEGPTAEERLVGFYGPERCLPLYPDSRERQEVPTLSVERADIRVSVPSFRAQQCTQSFHKAPKTSNGPPEATRDTHNNLSGQLVNMGQSKEELVS